MIRFRTCPALSLVALVLLSPLSLPAAETAAEEAVLKQAGFKSDTEGLLALFRKLTPTDADRKRMAALLLQFGSDRYEDREEASRLLPQWQQAALESLRKCLDHPDAEVRRRAQDCIEQIENGPGSRLPIAAVHLLAQRNPPTIVTVLLDYLPFAGDSSVHDAVCDALAVVSGRPGATNTTLLAALKDSVPLRRSAAAFALGRSRDQPVRTAVAALLADREPLVRYRAVQGLLAALERKAVPALIDLVREPSGEINGWAEEMLARLAGEQQPALPFGGDDGGRQKRRDGWCSWWNEKGSGINLARLNEGPAFLGITLVPEMHANKVWEYDREGRMLWELNNLQCPIDAQVLPGNRLLVAELNGHKVTERDRFGKILWEYPVQTPIACQRLANGSTFIATNSRLLTVGTDGKETWSYVPEGNFFIHSVQRMRNGHYAMVSMNGVVREVDAAGKEIRSLTLPIQGGWSGIEVVQGGNYLVCNLNQGKVLEVDAAGKTVWEYQTGGACYATRLANGNTLVVGNNSGLKEVDRNGKVVAEKGLTTSLWRVHRR